MRRFDLEYTASSLSSFLDAPRVGHLKLTKGMFGYLKKYPKIGYVINPQPLTIGVDCEKVQMKYVFGNQYA